MNRTAGNVPLDRLRQFARLDVIVTTAALGSGVLVYGFVNRSPWIPLILGINALAAVLMSRAFVPLRDGDAVAAVGWLAVGNWMMAIVGALLASFSWPIQILAAVVPVVVAVPYVSTQTYQRLLVGAVAVAICTASLGIFQDVTGLSNDIPARVRNTVLIVFTPAVAWLIIHAAATNAASLRETLDASIDANDRLRAHERQLRDQAELMQSSRSRIVAAADAERRRIERDLHDGAQQRLVGLRLQLSLASEQIGTDDVAASRAVDIAQAEVGDAQAEIRRLVRGLLPPVLSRHGVGPAIRSGLVGFPNPVRTDIATIPRLSNETEAGLYFMFNEAMQNIARHAGPQASVLVTLGVVDDAVRLEIADDGRGFDLDQRGEGQGLINMADRIGAVGGVLLVRSTPGEGTIVTGTITTAAAT